MEAKQTTVTFVVVNPHSDRDQLSQFFFHADDTVLIEDWIDGECIHWSETDKTDGFHSLAACINNGWQLR